ncbi:hypothetical protein [Rheinheimera sp. MMS21-TC3]|uniref:hypothetical protein n=1 Tax=Rheinheimera sp. MMS21-TC3 TaxID=3072790 RepID=UPI0028C4EA38|nr:hypothetical protein [Rheinheimera sp. MMS21-TC3]WNO62129.1 hypothetical protein RDV63_14570 [Rheinheimera sp. MMS21-TC3]
MIALNKAEVFMFSSSFKQQTSQWQQAFAKRKSAGPLQRLLAWLMLGVFIVIGAGLLLFMLLLSWIVIPILLFKHRAKVKAWQQQAKAHAEQPTEHGPTVIEGEVLEKRQD